MNEYQAYFFTLLAYPYLYFISLYLAPSHLVTIPILLFWYFVDPEILVKAERANGELVPQDNYSRIYAETDAITGLLFLDMRYLYKGKESFKISVSNFIVHWITSLTLIILSPLLVIPMFFWLISSVFQITVIYLYSVIALGDRDEQYEDIDVYY